MSNQILSERPLINGMGALAAAEVIQHFGPRPEKDLRAVFTAHGFEIG